MSVVSADVDVRGRGLATAPGFLFSLFRVAAWIVFFGGAAVTGLLVLLGESVMGLDVWGWIVIITVAAVGVFFTVISWGFLLLFARIADYIDHRMYFSDGG